MIARARMGDPDASIPTPEPVLMRKMYAGYGKANQSTSLTFMSQWSALIIRATKTISPVRHIRGLSKLDMKLNHALPKIEVDRKTDQGFAYGEELSCQPVSHAPLAQRYFLFFTSSFLQNQALAR